MPPKEFDVAGRTVIVTGAARGIGKGIVQVLAESGARVLATALTDRFLSPFAEEMAVAGHPIETLIADATRAQEMERTIQRGLELWEQIDVLVNNVGDSVSKTLVPLPGDETGAPFSDEEWRYVLDTNLTEAFLGCRAVGSHFLERRRGKVINVGSFASRRGANSAAAYSAAKAAICRLTEALAVEWGPYGITVNSIAPGVVPDPDAPPDYLQQTRERAKSRIPLGRPGHPREVGLLALYLVSDASDYVTGQTIYVDGGLVVA